ncbi:hypothetical protein [Cryobacterium psychrophilum]|nr:hypothetical protein [Cryobacterium psychrophilum]
MTCAVAVTESVAPTLSLSNEMVAFAYFAETNASQKDEAASKTVV